MHATVTALLLLLCACLLVHPFPHRDIASRSLHQLPCTKRNQVIRLCVASTGGVYVLQLDDGCYYIGKTVRPIKERVKEHFSKVPRTSWIRAHKPMAVVSTMTNIPNDHESWERAETLERMWLHGASRVRGWQYTMLNYTAFDKANIVAQLCERKDLCRR